MNTQTNKIFTQIQTTTTPIHRPTYIFKWVKSPSEIEEVLRFRFKIYFHEMGRDKKYADTKKEILRDPMDAWAEHLAVRCASTSEIVGIVRVNFSNDGVLPEDELYKFSQFNSSTRTPVALVSKMMIHKDHRGSRIFKDLCGELYKKTLQRRCTYAFLATADHLVALFKRVGFRQHQPRTTWADYGSSNPMVFDCRDINFLKEINSPLYEIALKSKAREKSAPRLSIETMMTALSSFSNAPSLAR